MTTTHQDPERHALIVSIVATAGISLLGILWGFAIGSQMFLKVIATVQQESNL